MPVIRIQTPWKYQNQRFSGGGAGGGAGIESPLAWNGLTVKAFSCKITASQNRISLLQFVIFCGIFCEIGNIGLGVMLF